MGTMKTAAVRGIGVLVAYGLLAVVLGVVLVGLACYVLMGAIKAVGRSVRRDLINPRPLQLEKLGGLALNLAQAAAIGFAVTLWNGWRGSTDMLLMSILSTLAVVFFSVGTSLIRRSEQ